MDPSPQVTAVDCPPRLPVAVRNATRLHRLLASPGALSTAVRIREGGGSEYGANPHPRGGADTAEPTAYVVERGAPPETRSEDARGS